MDPEDGAVGVFRDARVVVWLSAPARPSSLGPWAVKVTDSSGEVPGRARLTSDGLAVIWEAERPFVPGVLHFVRVTQLRDLRGREVATHTSRFVPCDLAREDFST